MTFAQRHIDVLSCYFHSKTITDIADADCTTSQSVIKLDRFKLREL